jgi:hypothetical protein
MSFEHEPGTARQILEDHGLTEVAIDGVLHRHAHELAEKIRAVGTTWEGMSDYAAATAGAFREAADLIDPEVER